MTTTLKNALRIIEGAKELVKDGDCTVDISFDLHEDEFHPHFTKNNLEVFIPSRPFAFGAYDKSTEHLSISFYC